METTAIGLQRIPLGEETTAIGLRRIQLPADAVEVAEETIDFGMLTHRSLRPALDTLRLMKSWSEMAA